MSTPSQPITPSGNRPGPTVAVTPARRALSADPSSRGSARRPVHTPLDRSASRDLLNSVRYGQPPSERKPNAPTPHARAATRALDLRRATIFTPGRNRRKSLREQRETPRDLLRALGAALAPKSQVIVSSSPEEDVEDSRLAMLDDDDDDSEFPIHAPRLSLPLDMDDDSDLQPPTSLALDDENFTLQSMEFPRRALSEQPPRMSLGSAHISGIYDEGEDTREVEARGEYSLMSFADLGLGAAMDDTTIQRIDDTERRQTLGRESGFNFDAIGDGNETTFMMDLQPANEDSELPGPQIGGSDISDHGYAPLNEPEEDGGEMFDDDSDGNEGFVSVEEDLPSAEPEPAQTKSRKRKRGPKLSQYGIEYPSLPPAVVKRLAQTFAQTSGVPSTKITPDTLASLTQASDWFFEQVGESLQAYAAHAGRKTIDESDVVTLMRRQRQIGASATAFSLAQKHLPRELLQHIKMPVPVPVKKRRRKGADEDEHGEG